MSGGATAGWAVGAIASLLGTQGSAVGGVQGFTHSQATSRRHLVDKRMRRLARALLEGKISKEREGEGGVGAPPWRAKPTVQTNISKVRTAEVDKGTTTAVPAVGRGAYSRMESAETK
jgi:hypothetical protein